MGYRAQVSVEYLILTGFLMLIVAIGGAFSAIQFNESAEFTKAETAVIEIVNNANWVASLGEGSRVFFEVEMPSNAQEFVLNNKQVRIKINTAAGNSDVIKYAKPDLTPVTLDPSRGRRTYSAVFEDGNVTVSIVE